MERMYNGISMFLCALMFLAGGVSCTSKQKPAEEQHTKVTPVNDLPDMNITLMNGAAQSLKALEGNVVFVFFQPDCDHCQREAVDIRRHQEAFVPYQLYFISSGDKAQIEKFAKDYELDPYTNMHFAMATGEDVIKHYGPIETPSLYIYKNGKLIQSFNGEVAIEVVVKYL